VQIKKRYKRGTSSYSNPLLTKSIWLGIVEDLIHYNQPITITKICFAWPIIESTIKFLRSESTSSSQRSDSTTSFRESSV